MQLETEHFFDRVCEALGYENKYGVKSKIATQIKVSKTTVGAWESGKVPGAEGLKNLLEVAKLSGASLHWLLTGEGPQFVRPSDSALVPIEIRDEPEIQGLVARAVRKHFEDHWADYKEELLKLGNYREQQKIQQLGNIDRFDIQSALEKSKNPHSIMRAWFNSEGRRYPEDYGVVFFQGWESFTDQEQIDAIGDAKKVLDRTLNNMIDKEDENPDKDGGNLMSEEQGEKLKRLNGQIETDEDLVRMAEDFSEDE